MRTRTSASLALCAGALLVIAPASLGDDFAPPAWRGQPLSVFAEWEFNTPIQGFDIPVTTFTSVGDGVSVLYPGFTTKAELDSTSNWAWDPYDGDGAIRATNPDGSMIAFKVQNWIDLEPEKWLRIQITWGGLAPPIGLALDGIEEGSPPAIFPGMRIASVPVDATHFYEDWIIQPNPDWESFALSVPFNTFIDQVVIDTISFPSPGTPTLLVGVCGLLASRRRRG